MGSLTTLDSHSASRLGDTFLDYHDEVEDEEDDSEPEVLEFDIQSREGRLPDSSYTDEETVFTWTDITGKLVCCCLLLFIVVVCCLLLFIVVYLLFVVCILCLFVVVVVYCCLLLFIVVCCCLLFVTFTIPSY